MNLSRILLFAAAGIGVGLLLSSRKGQDLTHVAAKKAGRLGKKLGRQYEDALDQGRELARKTRKKFMAH